MSSKAEFLELILNIPDNPYPPDSLLVSLAKAIHKDKLDIKGTIVYDRTISIIAQNTESTAIFTLVPPESEEDNLLNRGWIIKKIFRRINLNIPRFGVDIFDSRLGISGISKGDVVYA